MIPLHTAVFEMVRLLQVCLFLFGLLPKVFTDGLLCDSTIAALRQCRPSLPEKLRAEDPLVPLELIVWFLTRLVTIRNRLYLWGDHHTPKDPFTDTDAFMMSVYQFQEVNRLGCSGHLDERTLEMLDNCEVKNSAGLPKSFRTRLTDDLKRSLYLLSCTRNDGSLNALKSVRDN